LSCATGERRLRYSCGRGMRLSGGLRRRRRWPRVVDPCHPSVLLIQGNEASIGERKQRPLPAQGRLACMAASDRATGALTQFSQHGIRAHGPSMPSAPGTSTGSTTVSDWTRRSALPKWTAGPATDSAAEHGQRTRRVRSTLAAAG